MKDLLAYGLMALVIAALCLINWLKGRPVRQEADQVGLLLLEARDSVFSASPPLPAVRQSEDGAVHPLPSVEQPPAVRAAISAGGGRDLADYDRRLEEHLRNLFLAIGKSGYLKTRYFDYYNSLFALHRLFLRFCAEPEAPFTQGEWQDLSLYWSDRPRLMGLTAQRLSAAARGRAAGNGNGERREADEAI